MSPRQKALRKNLILLLSGTGVGVILAILGLILPGAVGSIILIIGLLCIFTFLVYAFLEIPRIKRNFCTECGEKYDYDEDVSWEMTDEDVTDKRVLDTVEFTCTCGNCGAERHFYKTFCVASVDDKGKVHRSPLERLVKIYMNVK